jgi:glutamine synthetase
MMIFFENGKMFDGSSFKGWQKIHQSDLALVPDLSTLSPDPFLSRLNSIYSL